MRTLRQCHRLILLLILISKTNAGVAQLDRAPWSIGEDAGSSPAVLHLALVGT